MQAALNYVVTAKVSDDATAGLTYMSSDGEITATIKLLDNVDNGSAWIIGCKAMLEITKNESDQVTKIAYAGDSNVKDTENPFNLTIDLNGKEYIFKNCIGPGNASNVGKIKAMRTYVKDTTSGSKSLLTIKNGELSVSDQNLTQKFERLATIYTDFTLDNVTINAAGVSNQGIGELGALIAQKNGTLTLQNGTTFTGLKDNGESGANNYFAIVGNTYGNVGTTYGEGFKLNINTDGTVGRIATYNENATAGGLVVE